MGLGEAVVAVVVALVALEGLIVSSFPRWTQAREPAEED